MKTPQVTVFNSLADHSSVTHRLRMTGKKNGRSKQTWIEKGSYVIRGVSWKHPVFREAVQVYI